MSHKINSKNELENFVGSNWDEINRYIDSKQEILPCLFYSSVDIRESKTKFAPVDLNIYPAGFNNVCMFDLLISSERFKKVIQRSTPEAKRIAIFPESHTKNKFYLDHLYTLHDTIKRAGFEVDIISTDESLFEGEQTLELISMSEHHVEIKKATISDQRLKTDDFYDFVVLNNDQSQPLEIKWSELKDVVAPSPIMGWFQREKLMHFEFYHEVVLDFCSHFSINPDLIEAKFSSVSDVDFASKEGLELIGQKVDELKETMEDKEASVYVKASQGTYGMGISVVNSGDEIASMNRKKRNKMDVGKNNKKFTSVLIQEGIETTIKYDDSPAEVTIYLIGGKSVGGFIRANSNKDSKGNLNSRGMVYQKYCISEIRENSDHKVKEATYSIIARLSTLAGSKELEHFLKEEK